MKIVVLSSSSKGNSTYIELNNVKFLIDAGLGFNDIKDKLERRKYYEKMLSSLKQEQKVIKKMLEGLK